MTIYSPGFSPQDIMRHELDHGRGDGDLRCTMYRQPPPQEYRDMDRSGLTRRCHVRFCFDVSDARHQLIERRFA